MALPPASNVQINRYVLCSPDGVARYPAQQCWFGATALPVPPPVATADYAALYAVSMDDADLIDHWHRLHAEVELDAHPDPAWRQHAQRHALQHTGAVPHPLYPHVRLGGLWQWAAPPHSLVQQTITQRQQMSVVELVRYHVGGGFV